MKRLWHFTISRESKITTRVFFFLNVGNKRPIITGVPEVKTPITSQRIVDSLNWSFSFKYFNQIPQFGIDNKSASWFASLFERLKDLSSHKKARFFQDPVLREDYRYHEVDWEARGIKIKRKDFNWIDKDILDNEEEFPFFQFHISKALGRVVGFWNETSSIFFIVVFDPLHNLQPSKFSGYKIRDSDPLSCEYTSLLADIQKMRQKGECNNLDCTFQKALHSIPSKMNQGNAFIFILDDDYSKYLKEILKTKDLAEVIEIGVINFV